MIWRVQSIAFEDTEMLGEAFGRLLQPPLTIELISDLGGGKTTFVRGLVRGLGSRDVVSSPTFTLNKVYRAKDINVDHYDFYRLSEPGIVLDQLRESINNPKTITVIEWSDTVKNVLPASKIVIKFSPAASDINERNIEISYAQEYENLINMLQTNLKEVKP